MASVRILTIWKVVVKLFYISLFEKRVVLYIFFTFCTAQLNYFFICSTEQLNEKNIWKIKMGVHNLFLCEIVGVINPNNLHKIIKRKGKNFICSY